MEGVRMEQNRRWSAREKLEIVVEGMASGEGIAEVCRRRGVNTTQYYTWRKQLMQAADRVFGRQEKKPSRREEKLQGEIGRMRAVIAEITAENLELKRGPGD